MVVDRRMGVITEKSMKNVMVNTTVQGKNIMCTMLIHSGTSSDKNQHTLESKKPRKGI